MFIARTKQGVQVASAQKAEMPDGFQKNSFKDQMREGFPRVCDWLMHNSLIG